MQVNAKARSAEYRTRVPGRPSDAETLTVGRAAGTFSQEQAGSRHEDAGGRNHPYPEKVVLLVEIFEVSNQ
jgi:hypothetical protein